MSVVLNTKHLSSFINEEEYKAIYPCVLYTSDAADEL